MALFASLYEDFEKLPPAGKVIASAAVVGVAILGVARFRKGGSSSSSPTLALPHDPGFGTFSGTFTAPGGPSSAPSPTTGITSTSTPVPTSAPPGPLVPIRATARSDTGNPPPGGGTRRPAASSARTPKSTDRQNAGTYDRRNPAPKTVPTQTAHPIYQQLHQATRPPRPQQMF